MGFSIIAPATFKAKVLFPLAGAEPVPVELTFKHRSRTELAEFILPNKKNPKPDAQVFMEMVEAWALTDEFTFENVEKLINNHQGVALAVFNEYIHQLTKTS